MKLDQKATTPITCENHGVEHCPSCSASVPADVAGLVAEWKKAAEGVTPGGWKTHLVDDTCIVASDGTEIATTCDSSNTERDDAYNVEYERMEADAAWIARCSPSGIRVLLDTISALSAKVEELSRELEAQAERYSIVAAERNAAEAILAERVEYLDENGKLVTESLRDFTKTALKKRFASLDDFLKRWKSAERKQAIIEELEAEGLALDAVADELGKNLDPFDLICHVAFDRQPLTRRERAENVRKRDVFTKYGPQARAVLDALLEKYRDEGVLNLDDANVLKVTPFTAMGTPLQLIKAFGGKEGFEKAVHEMQDALYQETA